MNTNNIYEAEWTKVPFDQYVKDIEKFCEFELPDMDESTKHKFFDRKFMLIGAIYNNIKIPSRETPGSAGYDFYLPFDISLYRGESVLIPTGIAVNLNPGKVLFILPRSGQGSKFGLSITNTCGVIDSDYYRSGYPGGHIFIKITHNGVNNTKPNFANILQENTVSNSISESRFQPDMHTEYTSNQDDNVLRLKTGDRFAQGVILDHYLAINEYYDGMPAIGRHGNGNIGK